MYSRKGPLQTPDDFNFPFPPYTIQQQLMKELYNALEHKQIGIFESPTGTGKSLTLTCSALKWLEDHNALVRQEMEERLNSLQAEVKRLEIEQAQATDWIAVHSQSTEQRKEILELKDIKRLLEEYEEKLKEIQQKQNVIKQKRQKLKEVRHRVGVTNDADAEFADAADNLDINISAENQEIENDYGDDDKALEYRDVQIFFCSRTHTQLAQVVKEIKRSAYGDRVRCLSLASRQQLCIHKQLRNLTNSSLINEKCLDMAKNQAKSNFKATVCDGDGCAQKKSRISKNDTVNCSYKNQSLVQELSEISLMDILDIEDLVAEGEQMQACPYYAARKATKMAQIIMLPYQILLHQRTREQTGINLKGNIVIIDEAHNLLDCISQMYGCEVTLQQLLQLQQQITQYKMKYASRFNSSNLLSINRLLFIIKRLIKILKSTPKAENDASRMLRTYDLMSEGDFFNIDIFELLQFCEVSRFAQKLQGFVKQLAAQPKPNENEEPHEKVSGKTAAIGLLERMQKEHQEKIVKKPKNKEEPAISCDLDKIPKDFKSKDHISTTSSIRTFLSFLEALCDKAEDGRILINICPQTTKCHEQQTSLKYILLNPGAHFQSIVQDARAIIIAGGTMQPTNELMEQLFHACPERVRQCFYDHVVPADAVLPFVVTKGPSGRNLCFNYTKRSSHEMLSDLGTVLENLCNVIPAGLVCFLPSYDYLDLVYGHLQKSGILQRISNKKKVFKEPRNSSSSESKSNDASSQTIEQLLNDYGRTIKLKQGALLLSVVGAKLSEGLNFSDDLGRGVIVVGMPYPNSNSPELKERISYLDATLGHGSGTEYYENLCMKAVNQCIGRSVRHIRDYACVYLLDERYARDNIQRKLPQWIARHVQVATSYGKVQGGTVRFFRQKKRTIVII